MTTVRDEYKIVPGKVKSKPRWDNFKLDSKERVCEDMDYIKQTQDIPLVNSCGNIPWSNIKDMLFICQVSYSVS
jgi:hypothetical protein